MKDLKKPTQDLTHFKRETTDALEQEIATGKLIKNQGWLMEQTEGRSGKFLQCDFHGPWGTMGLC